MDTNTSSCPVNMINELISISLSHRRYGGYKLELFEQKSFQRNIICPSCTGILRNASFSAGKNVCESCCPKTEKSTPVESVRETVNKLPCRCPLDTKGCGWTGVIGELETHLSVCEHMMVPCPFVDYGCEVGLVRRLAIQSHLKEFSTQHMMGRIMKVEEENRKAFNEIDFLKKENKEGFEKVNSLTKENASLKEQLSELVTVVFEHITFINADLRHTISDKELHGFEFTISDISDRIATGNVSTGPFIYLKKYKIQVYYSEFTSNLSLTIMRVPGTHDADLAEAQVGLVYYQILNATDSEAVLDYSREIEHPLVINRMSPQIDIVNLAQFVFSNTVRIRLYLEVKN